MLVGLRALGAASHAFDGWRWRRLFPVHLMSSTRLCVAMSVKVSLPRGARAVLGVAATIQAEHREPRTTASVLTPSLRNI